MCIRDRDMTPQASLDAPRFNYDFQTRDVNLEGSFDKETYNILKAYKHNINVLKKYERGTFGGGQIINKFENVIISGSDPRKDGLALSY